MDAAEAACSSSSSTRQAQYAIRVTHSDPDAATAPAIETSEIDSCSDDEEAPCFNITWGFIAVFTKVCQRITLIKLNKGFSKVEFRYFHSASILIFI